MNMSRKQETGNRKRFGKIGVLAGGPSNEREISLKSGKAVHEALIGEGCDAILLDIKDDICDIIFRNAVDTAFIALHGRFGEDGTVQRMLEEMDVPYTGSGVEASRLALDKIASKDVFRKHGIPVPGYAVLENGGTGVKSVRSMKWPVVVKPQFEGSSIGLSIARDEESFIKAAKKAFRYGDKILVEEYIDGRELTVGILGDKALPVIEIVSRCGVYDYEAKYEDQATKYLVPAPIDENAARIAGELGERSHRALGCRSFSRVDMMLDKSGGLFVLEVNTIPGMTSRSLLPKAAGASGVSFGKLCVRLLEDAIDNFKPKRVSYHGSEEK